MPSSTVLSAPWLEASVVPLPGGRRGAATGPTIGVATTRSPSHRIRMRRTWLGSVIRSGSDHVEEAVHVAERLHRAPEPVDEPGRAGHETLPVDAPGLSGADRERDRLVRLLQRARH